MQFGRGGSIILHFFVIFFIFYHLKSGQRFSLHSYQQQIEHLHLRGDQKENLIRTKMDNAWC